jgi:hypothetical protein
MGVVSKHEADIIFKDVGQTVYKICGEIKRDIFLPP